MPLLIGLLRQSEARRTMVFVNTKRIAERLEATLRANGFHAQALSGDVPQNKRLRFLRDFHEGELAVLIATDVASRGPAHPGRQPRVQLRPAAGRRPTTCTASAARRAPAPTATPSASPARSTPSRCRTSRATSATRCRSRRSRPSCSPRAWSTRRRCTALTGVRAGTAVAVAVEVAAAAAAEAAVAASGARAGAGRAPVAGGAEHGTRQAARLSSPTGGPPF